MSGNNQTHTVHIREDSTWTIIASVSIDASAGTTGDFQYVNLASPVSLLANGVYYLLSDEMTSDDWGNAAVYSGLNAAFVSLQEAYDFDGSGSVNLTGSPGSLYAGVNLQFTT
jgi:hypothetical protein